tara:strand:+ start:917 stop:1096 length:180 start_codon:yes stop_codon:yes gene_type:complete
MPRIKNQTDKTPRKRRGVKTTHIRVSPEKKPYIVELVKKPLEVLKGLAEITINSKESDE